MSEQKSSVLARSMVFNLDQLPPRTMANGGKSWDIVHGNLPTGEMIAIHVSNQPAGLAPNPPHRINHSEFICIREGTLEFQYDGKTERVGPGGLAFIAAGTVHSAKNVGDGPAIYFVVSIGGDTK